MQIVRLVVGPLQTNAYLLKDEESGAGVILDPGGDAQRIVQRCRSAEMVPRFVVNTHAHVDHIGGNAAVMEAFQDAELCIGQGDAERLTRPADNLALAFGSSICSPEPDRLLRHGEELLFGRERLRVIETPGHTPGAISLLASAESPPRLFCGDLIFRRGVGRTDLPGGDREMLIETVRSKVFTLPDEAVICPGHGEETTVREERESNPFVNG